jgi:hypothetical protein
MNAMSANERIAKSYAATHKPERERRKNEHQRGPNASNAPKPAPNALPPAPAQRHANQRARATPHLNSTMQKNLMQNEATAKKMRPLSFDLGTQGSHHAALTK